MDVGYKSALDWQKRAELAEMDREASREARWSQYPIRPPSKALLILRRQRRDAFEAAHPETRRIPVPD